METNDERRGERTMDTAKMTPAQRTLRSNIRGFLMLADRSELLRELAISIESGDMFRADCIRELINEDVACIMDATNNL